MEIPCTVLHIGRMYSDRARDEVCSAIRTIESVIEVDTDLCRGTVLVRHDTACDPAALQTAVERAGYASTILVEQRTMGRTESRDQSSRPAPGRQAAG